LLSSAMDFRYGVGDGKTLAGAVEPTRSDGGSRARVPVRTRPETHSKSLRRVKSGMARKRGRTGI
jgi:hypothetical protein